MLMFLLRYSMSQHIAWPWHGVNAKPTPKVYKVHLRLLQFSWCSLCVSVWRCLFKLNRSNPSLEDWGSQPGACSPSHTTAQCQTNMGDNKIKLVGKTEPGEHLGQKIETILLQQIVSGVQRSVCRHGRQQSADATAQASIYFSRSKWRSGPPLWWSGLVRWAAWSRIRHLLLPPVTHSSPRGRRSSASFKRFPCVPSLSPVVLSLLQHLYLQRPPPH